MSATEAAVRRRNQDLPSAVGEAEARYRAVNKESERLSKLAQGSLPGPNSGRHVRGIHTARPSSSSRDRKSKPNVSEPSVRLVNFRFHVKELLAKMLSVPSPVKTVRATLLEKSSELRPSILWLTPKLALSVCLDEF